MKQEGRIEVIWEMLAKMYEQMFLIRCFENCLESLFKEGLLFGTIHCCIGQEAAAVGVINALSSEDIVTGHHRSHGHYLAYADDVTCLMAEIMGKAGGIVAGRGGSQHIHHKNFYSNGVQGSMVPVATGMALAEKLGKTGRVAVCFIGDGTLGQGILYESMNMASLYQIPVIYVVENNYYAMSTHVTDGVSGNILDRGKAFGIQGSEIESNDVEEVFYEARKIVEHVRRSVSPYFLLINTYRLCGHSKSDDRAYRSREEEEEWGKSDPLLLAEAKLQPRIVQAIRQRCERRVAVALENVRSMPASLGLDDIGSKQNLNGHKASGHPHSGLIV